MNATPKRRIRPKPELALTVQYATRCIGVPAPAKVRRWAGAALRTDARLTVRIIGAREARALNRKFRGRDYATNVLTFIYSDKSPYEGDIALCAPVLGREARMRGISLDAHYAHLIVHGVLHLQGYDHQRSRDAARMEALEVDVLDGLGYGNPYASDDRIENAA
jgi:probable rRNA maturation factor